MVQLQDYLLGETVYEGPETRVRRATQLESGARLVAKLPVSAAPGLRIVGRLIHESQILAKLAQVPGVVRVHALQQQGGSAALLLHDPGFRSLDRVLSQKGKLSVDSALRIGVGLCRVLEGVHACGVMHKDVKPHKGKSGSSRSRIVPRRGGLLTFMNDAAEKPPGARLPAPKN